MCTAPPVWWYDLMQHGRSGERLATPHIGLLLTLYQMLHEQAENREAHLSPEHDTAPLNGMQLHQLLARNHELEQQNEALRRNQLVIEEARDRYHELYEFAPIGYITLARDGLIVEANLTASELLGVDRHQVLGQHFSDLVAHNDRTRWQQLFLSIIESPTNDRQAFDIKMLRHNQSVFDAHLDCLRDTPASGLPTMRLTLTDMGASKQLDNELQLAAIAFDSQEGIFITDADTVILRVNKAFTTITGFSPEEIVGNTPKLLQSGRHDKVFYQLLWASLNSVASWQGEIWNRRKNGELYPAWMTITAVHDNAGKLKHYVAAHIDIGATKAAYEQIERLVFYDPLTNLANRRLLTERLHLGVAASIRNKRHGALLFIDLDNFKLLNDTLGHDMGDLLLKQVAQRLTGIVREVDTVARLGGDEFVVMLEGLDKLAEEAAISAEVVGRKILDALNEPYQLAGHNYRCSCSIGATLFYGYTIPEVDLLRHVDFAMYKAKHNGRNNLCFFDRAMQTALLERTALEADLRQALDKGQLVLYYQKQVSLDNQIVGVEALIRWRHPELGLLEPAQFISLAEETGLILPIGQWLLETACRQLEQWAGQAQPCHWLLSVNISPIQFHQPNFVQNVLALLDQFAANPHQLKFELTESLVLININEAITKMNALRDRGVRFSMDNFGTGCSSLSHLAQLPLDQLKIDRSFIHNIGIKPTDTLIVKTIIAMTQTLGIKVIAEGVETVAQRNFLAQQGCTLYQGHLFGQPMPWDEFEAAL